MDKLHEKKQISLLAHGVRVVYTTAIVKVDIKVINARNGVHNVYRQP